MTERKTPLDWFFLVGMPVLFLAVAWWGITSLLGPPAPVRAVGLIKKGAINVGMTTTQVESEVGVPKDIEIQPDGTFNYVYHQGTAEPFVEEEATVTFSSSGVVTRILVEKVQVKPPGD